MQSIAQVANPESVALTLTITASVSEWRELAEKIPDQWPHWKFRLFITAGINKTVMRLEAVHEEGP